METTRLVKGISKLMADLKSAPRAKFGRQYRHELLNNLFFHPHTKVGFLEKRTGSKQADGYSLSEWTGRDRTDRKNKNRKNSLLHKCSPDETLYECFRFPTDGTCYFDRICVREKVIFLKKMRFLRSIGGQVLGLQAFSTHAGVVFKYFV